MIPLVITEPGCTWEVAKNNNRFSYYLTCFPPMRWLGHLWFNTVSRQLVFGYLAELLPKICSTLF